LAAPGQRSLKPAFFGGIMQCCSTNARTNAVIQYPVLGEIAALQTDPVSSRVAATFVGTDPFTSTQSGLNAIELNFGSLPNSGSNLSRSTFIDNNTFAALESPTVSSVINRQVSGQQLTTTLPLPTSANNSNFAPQLAMVTSNTVPGAANSLLPAGVSFCQCQYLQWGYWTGKVDSPATTTSGFAGATTSDIAQINTWIAGQPTVTMPTTGTASYNGAAIGTVFNNGASYLAAGGFNNTFNFGTNTGTVTISNFDGNSLSGTVGGSGNIYTGSITGGNKAGSVLGQFFGPGAVETGGAFAFHAVSGPNYLASGIFAGR